MYNCVDIEYQFLTLYSQESDGDVILRLCDADANGVLCLREFTACVDSSGADISGAVSSGSGSGGIVSTEEYNDAFSWLDEDGEFYAYKLN